MSKDHLRNDRALTQSFQSTVAYKQAALNAIAYLMKVCDRVILMWSCERLPSFPQLGYSTCFPCTTQYPLTGPLSTQLVSRVVSIVQTNVVMIIAEV